MILGMEIKVLICDDDRDFLSFYKLALEELGMIVYPREHCRKIVEMLDEIQPDVILMDNWIPDAGGIVTTRLIKNHPSYKDIPVLYISANPDTKILANEAGADSYLVKPFDIMTLKASIMQLCDSKL